MEGALASNLSNKEEELLKIKLGVNWEQKNCKFCGFLKDPRKILWENERLFAFYDISKATAVEHILICPKVHIRDVTFLQVEHLPLLREMEKEMQKLLNKYTPNYKYR